MAVGSSLFAYLNDCISGCSFLMMVVICWWYLRLYWMIIPRSFACFVFSIGFSLILMLIFCVILGSKKIVKLVFVGLGTRLLE